MSFKYIAEEQKNSQPLQYFIGTSDEVFLLGEIVYLSSGILTTSAATTAGTQRYVTAAGITGDGVTAEVPVYEIRKTTKFVTQTAVEIVSTAIGNKYTLTTAATSITDTTTAGVFMVDETDAKTLSEVVGHFTNADAV
jgi:hypothetical protein